MLTHVVGSLILALTSSFLGFFSGFGLMALNAQNPQIPILISRTALLQWHAVIDFVVHPHDAAALAGVAIPQEDAPPCRHP